MILSFQEDEAGELEESELAEDNTLPDNNDDEKRGDSALEGVGEQVPSIHDDDQKKEEVLTY